MKKLDNYYSKRRRLLVKIAQKKLSKFRGAWRISVQTPFAVPIFGNGKEDHEYESSMQTPLVAQHK